MLSARRISLRAALAACALALALAGCASSATEADRAQAIDVGEPNIVGEIPTVEVDSTVPSLNDDVDADDEAAAVAGDDDDDGAAAVPAEATAVAPTQPDASTEAAPTTVSTPAPTVAPAAPEPTATQTPEPTATATPPPTPEPIATTPPRNNRALPDNDTLESPRLIELDQSMSISGDVSVSIDDHDSFLFTAPAGQELAAVSLELVCDILELDAASRFFGVEVTEAIQPAIGECQQDGQVISVSGNASFGEYGFAVGIAPSDLSGNFVDASLYDAENGFLPYASYTIVATPTFAEEVIEYDVAPNDGDSANAMNTRVPADIVETVSAPDGDREDWFRFTGQELLKSDNREFDADEPEAFVNILCDDIVGDDALLLATLFDARTGETLLNFTCSIEQDFDFQSFKLDPEAEYVLQVQMQGTGSATYGWGFLGP